MPEPRISLILDARRVRAWGEFTADGNPLHMDPVFAARTRFGVPIVHGHLLVCIAVEALAARFGTDFTSISAQFRSPVPVDSRVDIVWDADSLQADLWVEGTAEPAMELRLGALPDGGVQTDSERSSDEVQKATAIENGEER